MHKNLTPVRVIFWRLLLEEYGPTIKYTKGPDNAAEVIASRLPFVDSGAI